MRKWEVEEHGGFLCVRIPHKGWYMVQPEKVLHAQEGLRLADRMSLLVDPRVFNKRLKPALGRGGR